MGTLRATKCGGILEGRELEKRTPDSVHELTEVPGSPLHWHVPLSPQEAKQRLQGLICKVYHWPCPRPAPQQSTCRAEQSPASQQSLSKRNCRLSHCAQVRQSQDSESIWVVCRNTDIHILEGILTSLRVSQPNIQKVQGAIQNCSSYREPGKFDHYSRGKTHSRCQL